MPDMAWASNESTQLINMAPQHTLQLPTQTDNRMAHKPTSKLTPSKANQTQTKAKKILPTYPTPNSTPTQPQPTKSNLQILRQRGSVFSEFDHTLAQGLDISLGNDVFSVGSKIPKTTGAKKKKWHQKAIKIHKNKPGNDKLISCFLLLKEAKEGFLWKDYALMRFVALTVVEVGCAGLLIFGWVLVVN